MLIQLMEQALKLAADTCAVGGTGRNSRMSAELDANVGPSDSRPAIVAEPDAQPEITEGIRAVSAIGAVLPQQQVADFAAAVIVEQIESLRRVAADLDRQYGNNVKKRKIAFMNRVDYLAVRERVASKIADLVEDLCQLPREAPPALEYGSRSWNPDDNGSAALSSATS